MTKEYGQRITKIAKISGVLAVISAGALLHLLTAFTLKSYYGSVWGGISLLFPVISELFLAAIQIRDEMYNYPMILSSFTALTLLTATIGFNRDRIGNLVFRRNR